MDIDLIKTGLAYVTLTCKTDDGTKLGGVRISGFCDLNKNAIIVYSDSSGKASGYVSPTNTLKFSVSNMIDITSKTITISNVVAGNKYVSDFTLETIDRKMITSSGTYYVSNLYASKPTHITVSGGGGGGAGEYFEYRSGGGCGGNSVESDLLLKQETPYTVQIGSGGNGGKLVASVNVNVDYANAIGKDGGATTGFGLTANGGGGAGKGITSMYTMSAVKNPGASDNGGRGGAGGNNGASGTIRNPLDSEKFIGGGGGGSTVGTSSYRGGASYGGNGEYSPTSGSGTILATSGSVPSGGGGGGLRDGASHYAGSGGSGAIFVVFNP